MTASNLWLANQHTGRRLAVVLALLGGWLFILPRPAAALTLANREVLKAAIAQLGGPQGQNLNGDPAFASLSGPEIGAVLLKRPGASDELRVLRVASDGSVVTLLSLPLTSAGLSQRQPFLFLIGGRHLLTYPSKAQTGPDGQQHEVGDLIVYDLLASQGPHSVFSLPGVEDLGYQTTEDRSYDSLLRQPSRHFLNRTGKLPLKFDYYRLSFDPQLGQYRLFHHLALADNPDRDEAANYNNRALAEYYAGRLLDASRWLERATQQAEGSHDILFSNQNYIKSEIDDLTAQVHRAPLRAGDEALMDFWQGDFAGAVRLLGTRQQAGLADDELALLGIALAQLRRWPETDKITGTLAAHGYPAVGDYAYELIKVAEYQQLPQVIEIQLKALEHVDPGHPGLTAALARVLRHGGQPQQAEALLAQAVRRCTAAGRELLPLQLEQYSLALAGGDRATMDRLSRDALGQHDGSLSSFVALADYLDLSRAAMDITLEQKSDHIKAPKTPLDSFGEAPPGFVNPGH